MKKRKFEVLRTCDHGDLKTNLAFPERRPSLQKGDIVEFEKEFLNFYGQYYTVKSDRSDWTYDIEPRFLKEITYD